MGGCNTRKRKIRKISNIIRKAAEVKYKNERGGGRD
jgi:hypothetical protein